MNAAAALLTASLGTYALRHVSVRALANRELPPAIAITLRHAALAVMAALVMSSIPPTGEVGLPPASAIVALLAAGIIARRSENVTAAIAIGITVYAATIELTNALAHA